MEINGKGPFAFIVDTGADRTVVADDLLDAAGMVRGEQVVVAGIVRTTVTTMAKISRLRLGAIECRDLVVPGLPRAMMGADGYLGLDVIDGHRVTFDFSNHILTVDASRSAFGLNPVGFSSERIFASGRLGHLRALDCRVDGIRATAFIDTGSQVSACNSSLFRELARHKPAQNTRGRVSMSGVTGGKIEGSLTSIDRIHLAGLSFGECELVIADFEVFKIWGLADKPALLIGMNLLRGLAKVAIDYGRKEIRFEVASSRQPDAPLYADTPWSPSKRS